MIVGGRRLTLSDLILVGGIATIATLFCEDILGGAAVVVVWGVWRLLRREGGVPVLAAALTFQWMQTTIGIWYFGLTGRRIDTMYLSDYRPMVFIGLGCVVALAAGLYAGIAAMKRMSRSQGDVEDVSMHIEWPMLIGCYIAATALQGTLQVLAYQIPELTQPILAFRFIRLGVVYLVMRRLTTPVPRLSWVCALVVAEIALGLTGYFAGFREPLVMIALALYELFNPRRLRHWVGTAAFAALLLVLSVLWINVRREFRASFEDESFAVSRQAQFDRMWELSTAWFRETHEAREMDKLIDRLWVVYYPALAVSRVPLLLPHTDGRLMSQALEHVFNPRLFFPTKAELQSDSEMVRKYSGVMVAGAETGTSIAFGYAAESYIDYGVPWMFVPMVVYGFIMGIAYRYLATHIRHTEVRTGLLAVVFWLALYLFERSWVKTLGLAGTLLLYLGGPALFLDYYLTQLDRRRQRAREPRLPVFAP